jgi:hypothetical protein
VAGSPDVVLETAPAEAFEEASEKVRTEDWFHYVPLDNGDVYICWTDLFEFRLSSDGTRIAARQLRSGSPEGFRAYLLGQVLSFALVLQGREPFHASVVRTPHGAVAFLGAPGAGKSTLAASMLDSGCTLLTDDVLVIDEGLRAVPGLPRIKLFPDVARRVLPGVRGVPMYPGAGKRIFPLPEARFWAAPERLALIVVPRGRRAGPVVLRRLGGRSAYLELTAHSFNPVIRDDDRLRRQMRAAAAIADRIPVVSASFPDGLDALPEVVRVIERRVAREA